ncbi:reverse transcriptase, partial [Globisporangium splendens]
MIIADQNGFASIHQTELQPLAVRVNQIIANFAWTSWNHTKREQNKMADLLANMAMNSKNAKILTDESRGNDQVLMSQVAALLDNEIASRIQLLFTPIQLLSEQAELKKMNGGLSVPNIRTELMTMSATAVSKWAITTSHIDQVIGEILLHNTRASSTYITPLDAIPRRPLQLRDNMWTTGAALCIIAERRKLRGTFCAEWLPYMTSTADGWLLDSNGSPYKLAHTSLSVGTAQLGITAYTAQTLLQLKANRLSMWNYEKADLSCSNPECSQVVQSAVQHLFWECPKAKLVWNYFYALWAKIGITPGHDPAIWIFSLDLPHTPRHAWTTIKRHIIGHKCSNEHLQDHLYPVAHMLWRYTSASLIHAIWCAHLRRMDSDPIESTAEMAITTTRLEAGMRNLTRLAEAQAGDSDGHTVAAVLKAYVDCFLNQTDAIPLTPNDTRGVYLLFFDASLIWAASMAYSRKDTTNNCAEYWGLIHGLREAQRSHFEPLYVIGDSALIISQQRMHRSPRQHRLAHLYLTSRRLADCIDIRGWYHHYRPFNKMADSAANLAMDTRTSTQVHFPTHRAAFNNLTQDLDNDVMHWLMRSSEDPRPPLCLSPFPVKHNPTSTMLDELGDEEHAAIVADALALIDACGANGSNTSTLTGTPALRDNVWGSDAPSHPLDVSSLPSIDESTHSCSQNATIRGDQVGGSPRRNRRSHHLSSVNSTAIRQRRKQTNDAIKTLRGHIARLETQLVLLHMLRNGASQQLNPTAALLLGSSGNPGSLLEVIGGLREADRAVLERYKRQKAEATNRKLKEMITVYANMSHRLDSLFETAISAHDLKAVFDIDKLQVQTIVRSSPVVNGIDLGALFELHQELDRLHATTKAVFMSDVAERERSFCHVRHDQTEGQVFEFRADTPMSCTFDQLDKYAHTFVTPYTQKPGQYRTETWTGRKTSYEKQLSLAFSSPQFGQFLLDGTTVFGVFEEARCSILVSVTRHVLRGSGLVVYERSWIIVADSQSSGVSSNTTSAAAQFQVAYQAFTGPEMRSKTSCDQYSNQLREFILHTQLQRMRAHMLEMQNVMLHEPEVLEDQRKLASCLLVECPMKYAYSE